MPQAESSRVSRMREICQSGLKRGEAAALLPLLYSPMSPFFRSKRMTENEPDQRLDFAGREGREGLGSRKAAKAQRRSWRAFMPLSLSTVRVNRSFDAVR